MNPPPRIGEWESQIHCLLLSLLELIAPISSHHPAFKNPGKTAIPFFLAK
jgi:hypothetical protein